MKRNTRHEKRLKRLIVTCLLCAIVLTVSTYAWFIGMQTVSIQAFDVKIASVDNLQLSLDGIKYTDELTINEDVLRVLKEGTKEGDNADDYTYVKSYTTGNTNSWTALEPMSSVGLINTDTSKMILFEKGSLTASDGGYRIMAETVKNDTAEIKGYVAFDLFIQNLSGEAYYDTITDPHNEEAVYLTYNSKVISEEAGSSVSGIENSVRVAFAQIGRVKADTDSTIVQGITCADKTIGDVKVTGICADRAASIWEPNDKKHVPNAITWFNKSCKKRTAQDTWTTACDALEDNKFYDTYAVSGDIDHSMEVDVYDGLNGYFGNITKHTEGTKVATHAAKNKLVNVDTFTDSEKMLQAENRQELLRLAPNSVTKVRVYIYIEGQDVDNYDFASLGKQVKINFGFTKERYRGVDIDEDNPPTHEDGEDQTIYR